jgi:acetyl-CoA acyltransferase
MKDVYIVAARRTPVGKAFRGGLRNKRPDDFCADVIRGVLQAAGSFDHAAIDDVYLGCAMPEAEQGMNVARLALLLAGIPESVPGVTINRFCSSGLQSIGMAADRIRAGASDCILAGGTESMTLVPMMGHKVVGSRTIMDSHPEYYMGMGLTAENVAADYNVTREEQDQFALRSHQKAVAAIKGGLFKDEIIPVKTQYRGLDRSVREEMFEMDDGPREDTSVEALAKLRAAFRQGGSVTAGNSSQMSDGAAACLVVSEAFLKQHKLVPEARFIDFQVAGVPPRVMGIGPIAAIPKVLKRAGIKISDIDRIELNEAFAAQAIAVIRNLGLDEAKVNPTGGAIALGHPLGATGAKLTATLLAGMKRDKQKYGLVSMCIGTGMGAAGLFERL